MKNTNVFKQNIWVNLKNIGKNNKKPLLLVGFFVLLENVLLLTYPLFGSFAVNAMLQGQLWSSLSYALLVMIIWSVGSARRAVDTRVFTRLYANMAVPIIIAQRQQGMDTSTIAARVALSRKFVDFFEQHLPILITVVFSIIGSVFMLLAIEFWSGVVACVIMLFFIFFMPKYTKMNDKLYLKLNNRLEKEVDVIDKSDLNGLKGHYHLLSNLRILLSNREAFSYLLVGGSMTLLFGVSIVQIATTKGVQAGHIYAVMTYLWTFATSLDDMPRLVEEFSNLKDVGQRVAVE